MEVEYTLHICARPRPLISRATVHIVRPAPHMTDAMVMVEPWRSKLCVIGRHPFLVFAMHTVGTMITANPSSLRIEHLRNVSNRSASEVHDRRRNLTTAIALELKLLSQSPA